MAFKPLSTSLKHAQVRVLIHSFTVAILGEMLELVAFRLMVAFTLLPFGTPARTAGAQTGQESGELGFPQGMKNIYVRSRLRPALGHDHNQR